MKVVPIVWLVLVTSFWKDADERGKENETRVGFFLQDEHS